MFKKVQVQTIFVTEAGQMYRRTSCTTLTHWDKLSDCKKQWVYVSGHEAVFLKRTYDNRLEKLKNES